MSSQTLPGAPSNSTNTLMRAWFGLIEAGLLAGGFTRTGDSGQTDASLLTTPGAINTYPTYQIWKSNDGGSGLNDFYFKLEPGSGGAINTPAIRLSVGWGSNGSGTLTGNLSDVGTMVCVSSSTTPVDCHIFAKDGNACVMNPFATSSGHGLFFSLARVRNVDGSLSDRVFVYGRQSSGSAQTLNQVIPRTGTVGANNTAAGTGWLLAENSGATNHGGNVGQDLLFPQTGGWLAPSKEVMGLNVASFPNPVQATLTTYGVSTRYQYSRYPAAGTSAHGHLFRFDV